MHFSAFLTTRSAGPESDRAVIEAMVEHATDAERLGFDAVFLPDHHFTGYAPPASDPMMFAAYLAAKLPRLHFGFSVQTIPLHHPVRFAERLNLIDQLTDGKVLVGTGSGTTPEEMIGLGVRYQDTKELSVSNLDVVERLWAKRPGDEPVEFDNGHYRGSVVSRIVPAPHSPDGPQLMSVAQRPSSTRRAAEQAQPAFIPAFTPPAIDDAKPMEHLRHYYAAYREALEAAGHSEERVARALEWTTHTYQHVHVADSDAQAEDEFQRLMEQYQGAIEREHVANKAAEAITGVELRPHPDARKPGYQGTWCLWGSPATVTEKLREVADLGIGNVLGGFLGGPLTPDRVELGRKSMRLFATEVMPKFREAAA
ncbi:LLM class flavin-dependent oxidoreductase [Saccharopolyspora flava]|uniref:Flavin-dependent oxidoreductase, luciferase family (Includes alkanesulfonate monooxygenase SsuD and methylene tetrahydromethanopterin reductase) n=1 Tax=Saccharopolyspora flava TaxID=95161 RepID=A0A1I6V2Y8_9PSEU|nr:LLM class flavin-dependent oxidoreductase [Saccharopolyspora flava]SFT07927.1 Flavin-dependent oxidoreductase, luciferase family (includes alkanesulfonate monooxygenase SsuD and methylene tetrahydromethanopterin reductase) [Saccharopolyspora flava]